MKEILIDLRAEQESLDRFLSSLTDAQWDLPTPAEGWTVRDSVSHIAQIDEVAVAFVQGDSSALEEARKLGQSYTTAKARVGREMKAGDILPWWRRVREVMLDELSRCDPRQRIPWFARPMGARAFATARLMETWAHGLDCYDAAGAEAKDTDRLRHVALMAYLARPYAYEINGLPAPQSPLRLELFLPSSQLWAMGEESASDRIRGKAGEFCRVAVRRRHWKDTSLEITGGEAERFMAIAQTYAGPPGPGRRPGKK